MPFCYSGWAIFTKPSARTPLKHLKFLALPLHVGPTVPHRLSNWPDSLTMPSIHISPALSGQGNGWPYANNWKTPRWQKPLSSGALPSWLLPGCRSTRTCWKKRRITSLPAFTWKRSRPGLPSSISQRANFTLPRALTNTSISC